MNGYKREQLLMLIEELRFKMIQLQDGKSLTDQAVVSASQKLDDVLNWYGEETKA